MTLEQRVSDLEEAQSDLVTRGELRAAIAASEKRLIDRMDQMETRLTKNLTGTMEQTSRQQADRTIEAVQRGTSSNF